MGDFLKLFTPIRFLKFTTEFLLYIVSSIATYWKVFLVISTAIFTFFYFKERVLISQPVILYYFFVPSIITTVLAIKVDFFTRQVHDVPAVAELEEIYVIDNAYFEKNLVTEKLSEESKLRIKNLKKTSFPFKIGLVEYKRIRFPKFFYYLTTPQNLNTILQKKVDSNELQCILQILIDSKTLKIDVKFFIKEGIFINDNVLHEIAKVTGRAEVKERNIEETISNISRLFQTVISHSFLELLINEKAFSDAHKILDESQITIKECFTNIQSFSSPNSFDHIRKIEQIWSCESERYRALIYLASSNYESAITHLFKAIKINPYYPFGDMEPWANEFVKKYSVGFAKTLETLNSDVINNLDNNALNKLSEEEIRIGANNALSQIVFPTIASYTEILIEIIQKANSKRIEDIIIKNFQIDICDSPMQEYIKGEVYKYIPTNGKKFQNLCIDRIGTVLEYFYSVLETDPYFPLIHNKIGSMLMIKNIEEGKNGPNDFDEAIHHMTKGIEIFTKFGFKIRND